LKVGVIDGETRFNALAKYKIENAEYKSKEIDLALSNKSLKRACKAELWQQWQQRKMQHQPLLLHRELNPGSWTKCHQAVAGPKGT